MPFIAAFRSMTSKSRSASFTLIELLTVMAIIAILAGLVLYAGNAVVIKGMRSRAAAEIQAMSTALESYKTDNGIYPPSEGTVLLTNTYSSFDPTASTQTNATLLYIALSGQANYAAGATAGAKAYMQFKATQVGNPAGTYSYVRDPWNYGYGYNTGSASS
jgi:prepilin-type N-terminal cleavage/methylation domain-containing protein